MRPLYYLAATLLLMSNCHARFLPFWSDVWTPAPQVSRNISNELFQELEEQARIVDIAYCVGGTGVSKPFSCASRCQDFPDFELVTTWNTGPLLSDSCGYITISHPPSPPRIIVAFRGTYSIANTIVDLSTVPQTYEPYPGDDPLRNELARRSPEEYADDSKCANCTAHRGFLTSWLNTRELIVPHIEEALMRYPDYQVTLIGHSLGGAVAAFASLEFLRRGWDPVVTTFGEPRIGNQALMDYMDARFETVAISTSTALSPRKEGKYRRVTHVDDPVPLLPLSEWGYRMHGGEVYISKSSLSPNIEDIELCEGAEDPKCIAGAERKPLAKETDDGKYSGEWWDEDGGMWTVPKRFRAWQLFFAHRDYFWRLGLCVPGGDPKDWWRTYPKPNETESDEL